MRGAPGRFVKTVGADNHNNNNHNGSRFGAEEEEEGGENEKGNIKHVEKEAAASIRSFFLHIPLDRNEWKNGGGPLFFFALLTVYRLSEYMSWSKCKIVYI